MKTTGVRAFIFSLLTVALSASAQNSTAPASASDWAISEKGPHHRIWERTEYESAPDGTQKPHIHRYTELATGLNFKSASGLWEESKEEIQLLPNGAGASAGKGQHKALFPADILNGRIELNTPEGKWLRSQVLGLAYFDSSSGKSVLIAELKSSVGEIHSPNVVLYPDAFTDIKADVRYTYTRAGFEQDIVLREQPPGPEVYGLNPATTKIEVLTEFFSPPQPVVENLNLKTLEGITLPDQTLQFGAMSIGRGKAFSQDNPGKDVPVAKQWLNLEGRNFLIEEVPMTDLHDQLQILPASEGASLKTKSNKIRRTASLKRELPVRKLAKVEKSRMKLAQVSMPTTGLVLDYNTLNTSFTNYTFQGDTTYYISGTVNLYGSNVLEGGTVLKYASGASVVENGGQMVFKTASYRPAVLTAKDDNTLGESISGSTGNPSGFYASSALSFSSPTNALTLHDLRILYASTGINIAGSPTTTHTIRHVQIGNVGYGIYGAYNSGASIAVENVLFWRVSNAAFYNFTSSSPSAFQAQYCTIDQAALLFGGNYPVIYTKNIANSLLVSVTNNTVGFLSSNNSTNASGSAVFQQIGGGSHYLVTNSSLRNTGATNVNATLLGDLRKRSTYPPIAYTNTTFNSAQIFSPQAQRDTDTPDIGYHYDPLDYTFGGCTGNSNITFTAGTAVGWFRTTSGWQHAGHGIHMADFQTVTFDGRVDAPAYFVRLTTVQENDRTAGYGPGGITSWAGSFNNAATVVGKFLRCSMLSSDCVHFRDDWGTLKQRLNHSEIYNGGVGGYISSCYLTNVLFHRSFIYGMDGGWAGQEFFARNCTAKGNTLFLRANTYPVTISVRDCAFDGTAMTIQNYATNASYADYDYNAYTNATSPFPLGGAHDQQSVTFNWQTGPFGSFYLPGDSVLIDVGSRNADSAGLYYFTTQTGAYSFESASTVDIGYHYVGVGGSNNPYDQDGDGIPNYLEDANGNGLLDSGETDWNSASDKGLKVIITRPRNNLQ